MKKFDLLKKGTKSHFRSPGESRDRSLCKGQKPKFRTPSGKEGPASILHSPRRMRPRSMEPKRSKRSKRSKRCQLKECQLGEILNQTLKLNKNIQLSDRLH
jgi:hypothetical protein